MPDFITPLINALAKWLPGARWPFRRRFPRRTVRLVPDSAGNRWNVGSVAGQPAMQLTSDWHVTNISKTGVMLVGVHIKKPYTEGDVLVESDEGFYSSRVVLEPGAPPARASAHFWLVPPIAEEGMPFTATVVVVDQYGNKHRVRKVRFQGRQRAAGASFRVPGEQLYEIEDSVERDVAAVLKAEVGRYRVSGRGQGALGSIRTTHDGRTVAALGGIIREHSPESIPLVADPEAVRVESDNLQALLNRYEALGSQDERDRFKAALLDRLGRDRPYASVAYLILLASFTLGWLPEALERARTDLLGAEDFAFGDCVILLDGLLRLQHHRFDDALLDAVEELENVAAAEHEETYYIAERIAAIHSWRMSTGAAEGAAVPQAPA